MVPMERTITIKITIENNNNNNNVDGYLISVEVKIAANNISLTKPHTVVTELQVLRNL